MTVMMLETVQDRLTDAIATPGDEPAHRDAARLIHDNSRIPPELALAIYANNVTGAEAKALAAAYPACLRILGETCFNGLARRFVAQTPSTTPDLNLYGEHFGDLLETWTRSDPQLADYNYLGDLARLEWLCHTAYYATDDPPFDFSALSQSDGNRQQDICFHLGHSIGLMQSDYPIMSIRELNLSNNPAQAVAGDGQTSYLVVSRPAFQATVTQVDALTYRLLVACQAGHTLGNIIETDEALAESIQTRLPRLIEQGWITGFTLSSATGER